jgi:hypothetical protein
MLIAKKEQLLFDYEKKILYHFKSPKQNCFIIQMNH